MDAATLKKVSTGSAAESAILLIREELRKMLSEAERALESAKDTEQLRDARSDFRSVRKLFRRLEYYVRVGEAAQKEL